ncbi:MAG: hypothetical protein AAGC93_23225 [Cyanobacteria bacterium P01_F01_bin.53]
MAKVSIRDVVLDELKERYPGDYTTSDRVIKLLGEVEALSRVPCNTRVSVPPSEEQSPVDSLAGDMMASLMGSVSVE